MSGMVSNGGYLVKRESLSSQISSPSMSSTSIQYFHRNKEISQVQSARQYSHEGVVTESDSCVNIISNNPMSINPLYAALLRDKSISNVSSCNVISTSNVNNIEARILNGLEGMAKGFNQSRGGEGGRGEELPQISSEHRIDLQYFQLQRLPSMVLQKKSSLQILNLSQNNFLIFPVELCCFVLLRVLKMDYNYMSDLPEEIAFLKHLEELSLSNNCFKLLPGSLQNMQHLRLLNVSQNNIRKIGKEIVNLRNIESLYINGNEFTELPSKFTNLTRLNDLGLDWFRYTRPPLNVIISRQNNEQQFRKLFELARTARVPTFSFHDFIKYFSISDNCQDLDRNQILASIAAENEDLGALRALLQDNNDLLNKIDQEGHTLLTQSLINQKNRTVQLLLDSGADPKKGGGPLGSALHIAVSRLNYDQISKFLSLGADPNILDFEGNSSLHIIFSIFQKDPITARNISEKLLQFGADPNILNYDLWTPLHIAVRKNQKEAIYFALAYNEKIKTQLNVKNSQRHSKIREEVHGVEFIPSEINSSGVLEESSKQLSSSVSEDGVDQNVKKSMNSFDHRQEEDLSDEDEDRSPGQILLTPSIKNEKECSKISKQRKRIFNFDKKGGVNKWTVVHLAASQGNTQMLEILSDSNACPLSMTKFSQTPRRVALQSLILFKIMRKQEDRWMLKNVLGDEEWLSDNQDSKHKMERNIQNLRGFIAETMKRKERFLHEQLDSFDDKEFGYSIKVNMQNNQAQNPRNKENNLESEEDEILDPDISFDRTINSFKFSGQIEMVPAHGTLKPQQIGNGLRRNSKGVSELKFKTKEDIADEDEDDLMNDIDECDDDNEEEDIAKIINQKFDLQTKNDSKNILRNRNHEDERSCVFMKNLIEVKGIDSVNPPELAQKEDERDHLLTCRFFEDIHSLEPKKYEAEIEKLRKHFLYPRTILQENLNVLLFLQMMHIRLSHRRMKFVNDKGTIPRNIHLMNEFLHSQLSAADIITQRSRIPEIFISLMEELFGLIKPVPKLDSSISQNANYQQYNLISQVRRTNSTLNILILRICEILLNLNCFDFFESYLQKCIQVYHSTLQPNDQQKSYNCIFILYENMHNFHYNQIVVNRNVPIIQAPNVYSIVGSPSYYYHSQKHQALFMKRKSHSQQILDSTKQTQQRNKQSPSPSKNDRGGSEMVESTKKKVTSQPTSHQSTSQNSPASAHIPTHPNNSKSNFVPRYIKLNSIENFSQSQSELKKIDMNAPFCSDANQSMPDPLQKTIPSQSIQKQKNNQELSTSGLENTFTSSNTSALTQPIAISTYNNDLSKNTKQPIVKKQPYLNSTTTNSALSQYSSTYSSANRQKGCENSSIQINQYKPPTVKFDATNSSHTQQQISATNSSHTHQQISATNSSHTQQQISAINSSHTHQQISATNSSHTQQQISSTNSSHTQLQITTTNSSHTQRQTSTHIPSTQESTEENNKKLFRNHSSIAGEENISEEDLQDDPLQQQHALEAGKTYSEYKQQYSQFSQKK